MGAPTFVAGTTANASNGYVTSCPVTLPSCAVGNLIIIAVGNGDGGTVTTPSGWTLQGSVGAGGANSIQLLVYSRVKQSGDPASVTFTANRITQWTVVAAAYSGQAATNPVQVGTGAAGSGTSSTTASLTPNAADAVVLALFGGRNSAGTATTYTPGSGWTARGTATNTVNDGISAHIDELTQTTAAATSETVTLSSATGGTGTTSFILAILPPATGTLSGTVTNVNGGADINGATVSLNDPNSDSTTTNSSGAYSIGSIPAGTYTATISASGYGTQTYSATITAGTTTTLNVALIPTQTDSDTLSEADTTAISAPTTSADSDTITETPATAVTEGYSSTDSDTLTETAAVSGIALGTPADSDTLAETPTNAEQVQASAADSDTLTETPTSATSGQLSGTDSDLLSETPTAGIFQPTTAADSDTVSDTVTDEASILQYETGADSDTLAEADTTATQATVVSPDSDTVTDAITSAETATTTSADSDTLTETPTSLEQVTFAPQSDQDTLGEATAASTSAEPVSADSDTLSETPSVAILPGVASADSDTLGEAVTSAEQVTVVSPDSDTVSDTSASIIDVIPLLGEDDYLGESATEQTAVTVVSADSDTLSVVESGEALVITIAAAFRIRVDLYSSGGAKLGSGPILDALACDYHLALDVVGDFTLTIPATDEQASLITEGVQCWITREGEGRVFKGIAATVQTQVDMAGGATIVVTGWSISRQLIYANTLLDRSYSNATPTATADDLLTGTGWSLGTVGSTTNGYSAIYQGSTIWDALVKLAQTYQWHAIEDNLAGTVSIAPAGGSTGLVAMQPQAANLNLAILPILGLSVKADDTDLWNTVVPIGSGTGVSRLTLQFSNRTAPYTVVQGTQLNGNAYWYIQDSTSESTYGTRTTVYTASDKGPIGNTATGLQQGANALYDVAAAYLGWHKDPKTTYTVTVTNLKHYVDGVPQLTVGQTIQLFYRGIAYGADGVTRIYLNVNTALYLLDMKRTFDSAGSDAWALTLSTSDLATPSDVEALADALNRLYALETANKTDLHSSLAGPFYRTVGPGVAASFTVTYDATVLYLQSAKVAVKITPAQSSTNPTSGSGTAHDHPTPPVDTSGSGSNTSGGGSAHDHGTPSVGTSGSGSGTSSGGSAHTHNLTGLTSTVELDPQHVWANPQGPTTWSTPPYIEQLDSWVGQTENGFGFDVGRGGTGDPGGSIATNVWTSSHDHSVGTFSNTDESAHTHSTTIGTSGTTASGTSGTESAHTHSVTIASTGTTSAGTSGSEDSHTHPVTVGVQQAAAPSSPSLSIQINGVDYTTALNGPWTSDFSVDVTPYFMGENGIVVQQDNTVTIVCTQLADLELSCTSMISTTTVVVS